MTALPSSVFTVTALVVSVVTCSARQADKSALASAYATQPFVVEELRNTARFENDGTNRTELSIRVRVQTDAGVQRWGQMTFAYASETQELKIVAFELRKGDGRTIRIGTSAVQDAAVQPAAERNVFQDIRQKHLTVPDLKPGDALALRLVWNTHTPLARGHFFVQHAFTKDVIVLDERLELDVPAGRAVTVVASPDAPREQSDLKGATNGNRRQYVWQRQQLTLADASDEKQRDDDEEAVLQPDVRMSTFATWEEVGRWYANLAAQAAKIDAAIKARTEALLKGMTSDEEKIRALYDYVSTEIRYVSLSFGTGRYAPHTAAAVLANQYGDCKDKHTLLASMLNAAGYEAWPVLTNSIRQIDRAVPSPLEFDHLITVVPRGTNRENWWWLDTTPGVAPFRMILDNLRGKQALVITVGPIRDASAPGPSILSIPRELPFATVSSTEITGRVNALGVLEAKVRTTIRGDVEVFARAVLRTLPGEQWVEFARGLAVSLRLGSGKISDARAENLKTTREPLIFEFSVRSPGHFKWTSTGATLTLPLPPRSFLAETPDNWKGRQQVKVGTPGTYVVRNSVTLPSGYKPSAPVGVTLTRRGLTYTSAYRVAGDQLQCERRMEMSVIELPAGAADEYFAFIRGVRADEGQSIEIGVPPTDTPEIPADATAAELYAAGDAAYDRRSYKAAAAYWKRTVDVDPKHTNGWDALGLAYEQLGQAKEAVEAFRKQIEVSPLHSQAHKDLARVLEDTDDLDGAREAYLKHVEIHPLDGPAFRDLGSMLIEMDRYSEALPYLEKAAALVKGDAWLHAYIGVANLALGAGDKADKAFEEAIRISPTPPIWTYVAWNMAERSHMLPRARELAQKTLTHAVAAMAKLDIAAVNDDHFDLVERIAWSWDAIGWIAFQQKDVTSAERHLKAAWMLLNDADTINRLGQLYEAVGRTTDAGTAYLLNYVQRSQPSAEAKGRLDKYFGPGSDLQNAGTAAKLGAIQERLVRLTVEHPDGAQARFVAFLNYDGKLSDVLFKSGDEKLRDATASLAEAQFGIRFPDDAIPRVPIRIRVACDPTSKACFALLAPATAEEPADKGTNPPGTARSDKY